MKSSDLSIEAEQYRTEQQIEYEDMMNNLIWEEEETMERYLRR